MATPFVTAPYELTAHALLVVPPFVPHHRRFTFKQSLPRMVSKEDILSITDNVCTMMLGTCIEPAEPFDLSGRKDQITGCIQISGTWSGVVMLQTTHAFVSLAACKMFDLHESELELAECQDTIAELTNMVGGNIKSLVPGPSYLSLPSVTVGKEFDIRVYGTTLEARVPVICYGQQLQVLLYRALDPQI